MAGKDLSRREYVTMQAIKDANASLGHHFFEASTMRFFRSRMPLRTVDGSRFFVTSEQFDYSSPRLYTLRYANEDGSIDTVGEFQGYTTSAQARAAARRIMRDGK